SSPLGNDHAVITTLLSYRTLRGACGIVFFALVWEMFSRSGIFPEAIVPSLETIALSLVMMIRDGSILVNIAYTVARVLTGLVIASLISIPAGILMGRSWLIERFCKGPLSVLMPIPSLAWVPLFILWFGVGNKTTIFVVAYAAAFPLIYNVWLGVRSIN